jgi:O-antigen/teichoic acid export membrane protein
MTLQNDAPAERNAQQQSDALKIFKGASITLVGRVSGRGLHLLTQVVLARLLGADVYGLYAIGWTLLRMLAFLGVLGFDLGIIRYGARFWNQDTARLKGVVIQSLGSSFATSAALAIALYLMAPWLATVAFEDPRVANVIRGFAPGLILYAGMKVAAAGTRVGQRMQYSAYAQDIGQPGSNLALALLFLLAFAWGLAGAVAAAVLSFAIGLGVALFFLIRMLPDLLRKATLPRLLGRELLYFSIPASLAGMLGAYLVWVDRLILGVFRPSVDVGIYQAISQVSILFSVILAAVATIASPMIARMHHRGELQRMEEVYRVTTKWALYLSLPFFVLIVMEPGGLITTIFGSEYGRGWLPLVILSAGQLVNVGTGAVHSLLVMTGHQKTWLLLSAATLAVNVTLNIVLIPRWGIAGAAVATALALSLLFIAGVLLIRVSLNIWPYDHRFLKIALATAVSVATLAIKEATLVLPTSIDVLLTALLAALAFGGTLAVVGVDEEDRVLLAAARSATGRQRRPPPTC